MYGERQEQWQILRSVARHASQVVKSTKVQLSLSSLLNKHYAELSAIDLEAEITLVSYMLKFAEKGEAHVLMEKWDRSVLDITTMLSLR